MGLSHSLKVVSSVGASQARLWQGTSAFWRARKQPAQPLVLFDYEACPYCRLVREALTEMDLDVEIRPCPKGGSRFRPQVQRAGGKTQFPYLEDPNTGEAMYESAEIIAYLEKTYEAPARPWSRWLRVINVLGGEAALVLRGLRGLRARPSLAPEQPLELYSFESSPYSRLVREVLCELEIPYLLRNTGKALLQDMGPPGLRRRLFPGLAVRGRNRQALLERAGRVQVPYLVDPNTGTEMFESAQIVAYLEQHYGRR